MRPSLALIILSLAGCVADNVSVFIRDNIAPEQEDDGCTFSPTTNESIGSGLWDISAFDTFGAPFSPGYAVTLAVINQIQSRASGIAAETNGVRIENAEVEILRRNAQGVFANAPFPGLPNPFSVPVAGFIPPAGGFDAPSMAAVTISSAIPQEYRRALLDLVGPRTRATVQLSIRLRGRTNGQIDLLTDEWIYPVELCSGCLVRCTPNPADQVFGCRPGQEVLSLVDLPACVLGM